MDELPVYNHIKFDQKLDYVDATPGGIYNNLQAAQQKISDLICPSDAGVLSPGFTNDSYMYPNPPAPIAIAPIPPAVGVCESLPSNVAPGFANRSK